MKNLYVSVLIFFISLASFAQAPELMSYQALVRNADGDLIQNSSVGIRISILQNSDTGTAVYTETHTTNTNENGLITLEIGSGSTSDDFSSIEWGNGTYYIQSETDPTGGTNYTITGTSQLLSVPYALYAKNSGNSSDNSSNPVSSDEVITTTIRSGKNVVVYTDTNAYAFYQLSNGGGNWQSQSLSGNVQGAVVSDDNIVIYTDSNAYAFYQLSNGGGNWQSQSLSGAANGAVNSNDNIVIYTDSNAYAFYQLSNGGGNWQSQSLSGAPIKTLGNEQSIIILTPNNAYAFYQLSNGGGNWQSQSISGNVQDIAGQ